MTAAVRAGEALVVFAEGTLTRAPGLLPFHLGGFLAAATAGVPTVPMAIRGTRSALRDGEWFPRRLPISVEVGPPIPAPAKPPSRLPCGFAVPPALLLRRAAANQTLKANRVQPGDPSIPASAT